MGKKYIDTSWDFRKENTKVHTHCFHDYPAMMIPQVAGRLIEKYGEKAELLFEKQNTFIGKLLEKLEQE